jgi:sulfhydrogenase subunit beta (sulfur reductase)
MTRPLGVGSSDRMIDPGADGPVYLPRAGFDRLLSALRTDGRRVIGPTLGDGAIVLDEIRRVTDLPAGWSADQGPGRYRLVRREHDRLFDHVPGPTSWKRWTFPPRVPLTVGHRSDGQSVFDDAAPSPNRLAFLGVRACEIRALLVQDRVLTRGPAIDRDYAARRANALVIAVECRTPASTCFCTSMGTGPEVTEGFDIALAELDDGFVVRAATDAGRRIVDGLQLRAATADELDAAAAAVAGARVGIGDPVPTEGLRERLRAAASSPRWADIAERCLECTNCTLVCPTCFCTSVTEVSDLDGNESVNERVWDSCHTLGFARVAGGNFRPRVQDRYRQWLTHKFSTWWDQFGEAGCVGCGRCVTWCPVGIDIRDELIAVAPPPDPAATGEGMSFPTGAAIAGRRSHPAQPVIPITATLPPPTYSAVSVAGRHEETPDVVTLRVATDNPGLLTTRPGQFVMAALPAFAAAPLSVSRIRPDGLELTVRDAGPATRVLSTLHEGDTVGLRGPLGRGWPVDAARGRDVVVVGGGIGLAPLRPLIDAVLADRAAFGAVRVYYGARTPTDRLYVEELLALATRGDLEIGLTVDRAGPDWPGRVGVVTALFDRSRWDGTSATAFVCGPERMMIATSDVLRQRGIDPTRIFVTLERNMACGVGLCGHCQLGPFFVCRDGPVFSVDALGDAFLIEGL